MSISYYQRNKSRVLEQLRNKRMTTDGLGRIYRIWSANKCYIGSTKNDPELRFKLHKSAYDRWKRCSQTVSYCTSFDVFDDGEVQYEVLEKANICNLPAREEYWINKFRGDTHVVNRNSANQRSMHDIKAYQKQYQLKRRWYNDKLEFRRLSQISV